MTTSSSMLPTLTPVARAHTATLSLVPPWFPGLAGSSSPGLSGNAGFGLDHVEHRSFNPKGKAKLFSPAPAPGAALPTPYPFLSDPHDDRSTKSPLEGSASPWTRSLVLMCLISCFWLALGEPEQEEPAGMVFDQSSRGAPAWLAALGLLLISPWRTKKEDVWIGQPSGNLGNSLADRGEMKLCSP